MSVPSVQSSRGHHQDTELTGGGETMGRFGAVWSLEGGCYRKYCFIVQAT